MVKGQLICALDFAKRKDDKREVYSYRKGVDGNETWYWVSAGPGYSNTYRVTEMDADGEAKLKSIERGGVLTIPDLTKADRTV